jgi:hypothetical protein
MIETRAAGMSGVRLTETWEDGMNSPVLPKGFGPRISR